MFFTTAGTIDKLEYDKVVDIERISFRDQTLKTDNYIEIPRSIISFEKAKAIVIEVFDDERSIDMQKSKNAPKIVFNSILYLIRQSKTNEEEQIIQFSAGGIIYRVIMRADQHTFRLRGQRKYKIAIYEK